MKRVTMAESMMAVANKSTANKKKNMERRDLNQSQRIRKRIKIKRGMRDTRCKRSTRELKLLTRKRKVRKRKRLKLYMLMKRDNDIQIKMI